MSAHKTTKNMVIYHFCILSNCLIPNQLSGITMVPKTKIYTHVGIKGKNSCTAYTKIIPSKAQYIIKFDAYISEVSDAPMYPNPPPRESKLTFKPLFADK